MDPDQDCVDVSILIANTPFPRNAAYTYYIWSPLRNIIYPAEIRHLHWSKVILHTQVRKK